MEQAIQNMIADYELKIENTRKLLQLLSTRIPYLRSKKEDYTKERREQAILHAQLHAYTQAPADFDCLLDELAVQPLQ